MKGKISYRGVSLVEVAMSLVIISFITLYIGQMMADNAATTQAKAAVQKMGIVNEGAKKYVADNKAALEAYLTTPTQVVAIPVAKAVATDPVPTGPHATLPSLQAAGYVSTGFLDANFKGQRHALLVRESATGVLDALVVTYGDRKFTDEELTKIQNSADASIGVIYSTASSEVKGAYGSWSYATSDWANAVIGATNVSPGSGQAAISVSYSNAVSPSAAVPQVVGRGKKGEISYFPQEIVCQFDRYPSGSKYPPTASIHDKIFDYYTYSADKSVGVQSLNDETFISSNKPAAYSVVYSSSVPFIDYTGKNCGKNGYDISIDQDGNITALVSKAVTRSTTLNGVTREYCEVSPYQNIPSSNCHAKNLDQIPGDRVRY